MKRFLLIFSIVCLCSVSVVFAEYTADEVLTFFDNYVKSANSFDKDLFAKYYSGAPAIYRVVEKKDGSVESVKIPFDIYKKEAAKNRKFGKLARYKNSYSDLKVSRSGEDFKLEATRNPSPGGSFSAYFIIGPDSDGNLKIKTESMNTPRDEFLKHKN